MILTTFIPLLATIASLPSVINAHATFQEFWVGSTDMVSTCVRLPFNNSPVTDVTSTDIACNTAQAAASPGTCTVAAGGSVTVEMHSQPNDRDCSVDAIGGNHDGPVIIYMAKVDNALTAVGSSAKWFKVAQMGYQGNDYWATDYLNDNCGKFTFTVPSCLPAGDYLIRAEVIALHVAFQTGGAQFYMSCYTVKVTGGGSASPATVSLPGAYSATDPGIYFDLYGGFTSYPIPGPAVFTCGSTGSTSVSSSSRASSTSSSTRASSSSSSSRASSTSSSTRASSSSSSTRASSSTRVSSTSSSRTSSASTAGQTLYGQCGGSGWNGPTTCAQGVCTYSNAYYSQCL